MNNSILAITCIAPVSITLVPFSMRGSAQKVRDRDSKVDTNMSAKEEFFILWPLVVYKEVAVEVEGGRTTADESSQDSNLLLLVFKR